MPPGILTGSLPLTALKRVSPSRFQSLKDCALREVWAAGGVPPQLPATPAARLGSAIHRLLEEAGKGLLWENGSSVIEKRWEVLVAEAEGAMQLSWLERQFVPLRAAVSDYQVRRLRAIQRAREIAQCIQTVPLPSGGDPAKGCELWVVTPDGLAGGYIDQVEASPAGPVLRDYKSGHILEAEPVQGATTVKATYEVQLKLYASIYASAVGVWPGRLELVPLHGPVREVAFTDSECQELLRQAREAITSINSLIAEHPPAKAEAMLATPSPGACRYCVFRPSCGAYRNARERADAEGWPEDLWGRVRDKRVLGNGRILLTLEPSAPGLPLSAIRGRSPDSSRHPALPDLSPGHDAAVFSLRGCGQGGTFQETAWTVIYRLEGGSKQT